MHLRVTAALLLTPVIAIAQQTGSVSGHVYFAGTNAPARFATVALQPVAVKPDDRPFAEKAKDPAIHVYPTALDGSFQVPRVPPGTYYVVVKYPGYLSPFSLFSNADLVHPAPDVQQRIAALLPTVTVSANNAANIDIRLTRGASVAGTVMFDDGTPYAGASVSLMQRGADGKLMQARLSEGDTADDQGHFRMTGLIAGEYILQVGLNVTESITNSVLDQASSWYSKYHYSLQYYSGDTPRQHDAKSFKLEEGEDLPSQNLTIPITKLHGVSGNIVEQKTGRAINKGTVTLLYADDNSELTKAEVTPDESGFHFSFVPEGEYVLKVSEASDVRHEEIANPPGTMPPTHTKDTTLRTYTGGDPQSLIVHGDMEGLNLPVVLAPSGVKAAITPQD
jgi:Carboxypeptidase regulatory-like domain